jgi:[ribosomal protein S5]-alanine N-acetyltransferase
MQPLIPERLQTDRMVGERLTHDHEAEMARLLLDPRVEATLWPFDRRQTAGDVQEGLARQLDLWRCHGFGLWLLRDRATLGCVGRGGLEYTDAPGTVAVEVAWTIAPDRWGEGLATELARAAVHVAFAKLDVPALVALTLPGNLASRRVMEKAGFAYERDIVHVGLPHVLYRLDRPRAPEPDGTADPTTVRARPPATRRGRCYASRQRRQPL